MEGINHPRTNRSSCNVVKTVGHPDSKLTWESRTVTGELKAETQCFTLTQSEAKSVTHESQEHR